MNLNFKLWLENSYAEEHHLIQLSKTLISRIEAFSNYLMDKRDGIGSDNFTRELSKQFSKIDLLCDKIRKTLLETVNFDFLDFRKFKTQDLLSRKSEISIAAKFLPNAFQSMDSIFKDILKQVGEWSNVKIQHIQDKMSPIKAFVGDIESKYNNLKPLFEKYISALLSLYSKHNDSGVDYRPQEAVPEDYYAL